MSSGDRRAELSGTPGEMPGRNIQEMLEAITPVSRETIDRLELCRTLLLRWQNKTNLVSPTTLDDFWTRHVADSLQLIPLARLPDGSLPQRWIDMGSGGGFPALVLAIALSDEQAALGPFELTMIESIQKKCAFLRRVLAETALPSGRIRTNVVCARIESAPEYFSGADIVTARALAPLTQLLDWTRPFFSPNENPTGRALFHKGRDYQREVEESRGSWEFDLIHHPSRIDPESVVLEISQATRKEMG